MTDELERLRRLHERTPPPDRSWVDDTRSELLAMADEEVHEADEPAPRPAATPERLLRGLLGAFRRPAVVAAAAVVLVGAVGVGVWRLIDADTAGRTAARPGVKASAPTSSATPPTTGPRTPLAATCSAPDGTYTVSYPDGWHTNPGEQLDACQVFDPQPVALDEGVGGEPFGAVTIRTVPVPFDVVGEPGRSARLLSEQATTVDGHDAARQTIEHTGEGAIPDGTRAYRYLIDLDDRVLVAATYDLDGPSFEDRRQTLDRMVGSLDLAPAG